MSSEMQYDGEVREYLPPQTAAGGGPVRIPFSYAPRVYYIPGVGTKPDYHVNTCKCLSIVTNRRVVGVYNATAGLGGDLVQVFLDWTTSKIAAGNPFADAAAGAVGKAASNAVSGAVSALGKWAPAPVASAVKSATESAKKLSDYAESKRVELIDAYWARVNKATGALFRQLRSHLGQRQWMIAHSQGNLVICGALWSLVRAYGDHTLDDLRVYSLSSPAPAWPPKIHFGRRWSYNYVNDPITWLALPHTEISPVLEMLTPGDRRVLPVAPRISTILAPHEIDRVIFDLKFADEIRAHLGLPSLNSAEIGELRKLLLP